jgi:hypothetical protein
MVRGTGTWRGGRTGKPPPPRTAQHESAALIAPTTQQYVYRIQLLHWLQGTCRSNHQRAAPLTQSYIGHAGASASFSTAKAHHGASTPFNNASHRQRSQSQRMRGVQRAALCGVLSIPPHATYTLITRPPEMMHGIGPVFVTVFHLPSQAWHNALCPDRQDTIIPVTRKAPLYRATRASRHNDPSTQCLPPHRISSELSDPMLLPQHTQHTIRHHPACTPKTQPLAKPCTTTLPCGCHHRPTGKPPSAVHPPMM